MRCNVRESNVLRNALTLGSMVNKNLTLTYNTRCSQQKSLGDVTETLEFTEHISFAHLDARQLRIQC